MPVPVIDTYAYSGQPSCDFPRWLWFRNWAQSSIDGRLVIPGFEIDLTVRPGQTIRLHADRRISVDGVSTDDVINQD